MNRSRCIGTCTRYKRKNDPIGGGELLDTGAVLSVIPKETWRKTGFDKEDLIDSRIRLSVANKGALRVLAEYREWP